jgi:hypothetical protein
VFACHAERGVVIGGTGDSLQNRPMTFKLQFGFIKVR